MKYILTIVIATLIASSAFGQKKNSGIYLTVKCAKKSEKHIVVITSKQVCLAPQPIVLPAEFNTVTDLQETGDKVWFDLTLSNKSVQLLQQLSSNLPNSTFAFMIAGNVFTTFASEELKVTRTFRFQGTSKNKLVFAEAQKDLKTILESNMQ